MSLVNEVQPPDWREEGDCRANRCGRPLASRPAPGCYLRGMHRCNARHGGAIVPCDLRKRDCQRLEQEQREARLGVKPDPLAMAAGDVLRAIRERHAPKPSQLREWLLIEEADLGGRRLDVLALRLWSSAGLHAWAYEIKVDRSDLLAELRTPAKRAPALECSTQFWFATPVGLMAPEEVPDECGLVEFGRSGNRRTRQRWQANVVVPAPEHEVRCAPVRLVHVLGWRLRDMELNLRGRGIVL